MEHIELRSRVGPDGVLKFSVPVGMSEANREVKITVQSIDQPDQGAPPSRELWKQFVDETAGHWDGEPLVRPDQGEFEKRDDWEA